MRTVGRVSVPDCSSQVVFVGDTHGDMGALEAAVSYAAAARVGWVVSVGDLCWRPRAADHAHVVGSLRRILAAHRVRLLLVDGNNDDARSLSEGSDGDVPVRVFDRFWYAPRGSSWVWQGRRFVGLGGAPTFRKKGRTLGVDLFEGEELDDAAVARACSLGSADVLVCHDAPAGSPVPVELVPGPDEQHRARVAAAVSTLQPALVVHGHYHRAYEHLSDAGARTVGLGKSQEGSADVLRVDIRSLTLLEHVRTL